MKNNVPGMAHRKGLSLPETADLFRDNDDARRWIESVRWPQGPFCPLCGSFNVQRGIGQRTMTHRCRDCEGRPMFTVRTCSVIQGTKMPYRAWAVGIYLLSVNLKGISSMQLHRELKIGQKSAWFVLHRLRAAMEDTPEQFAGPVEVDETQMGGRRRNKSQAKRRDRRTRRVPAKVVKGTDAATRQGYVMETAAPGATLYTGESAAYPGMPEYTHEAVNQSVGEYVRNMASTNGMESFWSMMKRGDQSVYHKMPPKHLQRYFDEFYGRHNVRESDTINQMAGMTVTRLRYPELIADDGLANRARS